MFYMYAIVKDYPDGKKYRLYNNYELVRPPMPEPPVPDFGDHQFSDNILHHRPNSLKKS